VVLIASAALGLTSRPANTPGTSANGELVSLILGVGVTVDVRTRRGVDVLVIFVSGAGEILATGMLVDVEEITGASVGIGAVELAAGTRVKVERTAVGVFDGLENGESKAQLVTKNKNTNNRGTNLFV
jgi:hypothetical protein